MSSRFLFFILCFLCLSNCMAGTIDPYTSDSKYVEYAKGFPFIAKICGDLENGSKFCASAVIIDDHNFLTAAHVVKGASTCSITLHNGESFHISTINISKKFEDSFGVGDIAIGHSDKSFGLKYYPVLYEKDDEENKLCSISGYGLTGTFNTGATFYDGKKRAGSNIVDRIELDMLVCSPSPRTSQDRTSLEFLIASGDSGGGLFIDGKLAGINSCVMAVGKPPCSKYGEESGHTRISKFLQWIKDHKKQ